MRVTASVLTIVLALAATPAFAQGYSGVIAEDPDAPAIAPAAPQQQEAPQEQGYDGVIQGQTKLPGQVNRVPVQTSGQIINQAAMTSAINKNEFKPTAPDWTWDGKREHVNGRLPAEDSIIKLVSNYKKLVENPNQTQEKQKENAKLVYKQLSRYLTSLQQQFSAPVDVYKRGGIPDVYIKDEKESLGRQINTLQKAIEEFKAYL